MTLAGAIPAKRVGARRALFAAPRLGHHVKLFGDCAVACRRGRHAVPSPTRPHPQNVAPGNHPRALILTAPADSHYISDVPTRKLQVGQVWKKEDTGESYLVTKVYNEALTTFAILRKAGAESERPVKVKVDRKGPAYALPGFSYAQESDEF